MPLYSAAVGLHCVIFNLTKATIHLAQTDCKSLTTVWAASLLSWRDTAVLTDPFWSHLPFRQIAFGKTPSDPKQVDPYLSDLAQVEAVLVGHSHYDHVLDLPYVAAHLAPNATVLGGNTLAHTLAPLALPLQMTPINDLCASPQKNGQWIPLANERIRVLPIASGHPNNYAFIHLWTDGLTKDRTRPPIRASHFQEGRTFAFLVDFFDGRNIQHRVYIQTSSRGIQTVSFRHRSSKNGP